MSQVSQSPRSRTLLAAVLLALLVPTQLPAHDNPGNKLVDFRRSGAWEIWCLDIGGAGRIECDLNIVLNYVPNPEFRGMIPRVYLGADGAPFLRLDYEAQTSFSRGYLQVDGSEPFPLSGCERPCMIKGASARQLVDRLSMGRTAAIHFHDHVVEAFDVPIDLDGFAGGLMALREMQNKYRPQ